MQQTLMGARSRTAGGGLRAQVWKYRWCYAFLAPGLILMCMFSIYPLFGSIIYSLYDWSGIGPLTNFVGLGNFDKLLHDAYFWGSVGRAVWFAGVATPVELAVSLLIAILLNERALRLGPIFRTFFFIPVVTTTAVMSVVMSFVFSAYGSPVNQALQDVHLIRTPIDWLGSPRLVMWTAIGIFVWKWMGQPMIYWLAGLQTIPGELYEAARVDGAHAWALVRHITVPLMVPFAVIISLIVLVGNLQVFAFLQALTGGGPFFSTETIELFIFRMAFASGANGTVTGEPQFGYAAAAGVFFAVLMMAAVGFQAIVFRRIRPNLRADLK
ncbi:MAG: sugar ABC transporter permease [Candidatus Dormibacteraeota bacterium]|nr:sugar ABC transporter permease [Candidatus Dormibacteraeota bacterium]